MLAVISDIHANLEALEAVLADLDQRSVRALICLGDIVGFGPDPVACLRKALAWPVVIAGEWDRAVVNHEPTQWMEAHNREIGRTQEAIAIAPDFATLIAAAALFRDVHTEFGCQFCHAIPSDVREFVFPEDIYHPRKLDRISKEFEHTLFAGHTHIPGLFALVEGRTWQYSDVAPGEQYDIRAYQKLICNVGSVGQSRDGDPRASYVLFDGEVIEFCRIDYDYETTAAKIRDDPNTDDIHGDRLPEGR